MKVKVKKLHADAIIPTYAREGDAGMDLYTVEAFELKPGERKSVPLGISVEIPQGHVGLIWDKSGLSHTYGLKNFGGVIDTGYRGELHAGLMNLSDKPFRFEKGHKVAQMIIQKFESVDIEVSEELSSSTRGKNWLGSSGK